MSGGKEGSHTLNDPRDNYSLADRAKAEKKAEKEEAKAEEAKKNQKVSLGALLFVYP